MVENSSVAERLSGVLDAVRARGIDIDPDLICFDVRGADAAVVAVDALLALEEPPTAVVASDSIVAVNVLTALRAHGLGVPEDLSFVLFGDFPWTALVDPPLTVVAQPVYEVGATAADSLLRELRGEPDEVSPAGRLRARVVYRDSIGAPRVKGTDR